MGLSVRGRWQVHCEVEHDPLMYLFFITYLNEKESDDYTGMDEITFEL